MPKCIKPILTTISDNFESEDEYTDWQLALFDLLHRLEQDGSLHYGSDILSECNCQTCKRGRSDMAYYNAIRERLGLD